MLCNLHTHTTFCDGHDTAEEMVKVAIEKGFSTLGFSGHGFTTTEEDYCMQDTKAYMNEIFRLKAAYADKIEIYCGVEEDASYPISNRSAFEYILGSSHYLTIDGTTYSIDESLDAFKLCLKKMDGDYIKLADAYYDAFCRYIFTYKPDIIGHFDLITKYDERLGHPFQNDRNYQQLASSYIAKAAQSGAFFELNTGALARGHRSTPYPAEPLLYTLKKNEAKLVLNSDCHRANMLDYYFHEARDLLRDIGFTHIYGFSHGEFVAETL